MKTIELFQKKSTLSFEVFPPKNSSPAETIYKTIDELKTLNPDFISVTYGAGGNGGDAAIDICSAIKNKYCMEPVVHLPCINFSKEKIVEQLEKIKTCGIENILALRGDVNPEIPPCNDFKHASELISFIKEYGDFNIIGACYPEGHPQSENMAKDILNLKRKVDAGCSQLITQMFFDNNVFYDFREKTEIAGINVPIEAGIMPVTNCRQIERMVTLCKVKLPRKFITIMEKYENNPTAMRDAGIAYAVSQIVDLAANGIDGVHLYTMNNSYVASKIYESVKSLF